MFEGYGLHGLAGRHDGGCFPGIMALLSKEWFGEVECGELWLGASIRRES